MKTVHEVDEWKLESSRTTLHEQKLVLFLVFWKRGVAVRVLHYAQFKMFKKQISEKYWFITLLLIAL